MAEQQQSGTQQEQYNLVYTLGVQGGIKRDGTTFESREFSSGEWCRFQRINAGILRQKIRPVGAD
jgi:hypothetical protein